MKRSPKAKPPAPPRKSRQLLWIYALLFALTFAAYAQVTHFDFVNFDDPDYVTANPHVLGGITADSVLWALTSGDAANWFPLTRLSHLVDYELFGLRSGWHHFVNVLLHAFAVLLLFAFLHRATGRQWPSLWVSLLFAIHPLHVESVAWVAERKDVLCALFSMLALWCYVRWTAHPSPRAYAAIAAALALALASKPMAVTLPLIFVLLDRWPLARGSRWREKIPLFGLSAAAAAVTYLVQQAAGAVRTSDQFPLLLRIENAAVSYGIYIFKFFWPARLAVFYPFPATVPLWQALTAALVITAITVAVFRTHGRSYLVVGWLWYLVMLAPVIGVVQVGAQARADRYTYMPTIGLGIMLAWGAADFVQHAPRAKRAAVALAAASCVAAAVVTWVQTGYWHDSRSLFQHAVDVTEGNYLAHHNLGIALAESPEGVNQAVEQYRAALQIRPDYIRAHTDLGSAYAKLGRLPDAMAEYRAAIALDPSLAIPHNNLGNTYAQSGQWNEAISEYEIALRLDVNYADARRNLAEAEYNLGLALAKSGGQSAEAVAHLEAALRNRPDYPEAHNNLGVLLSQDPSRLSEAIAHFEAALRIDPNYADAHVNLAVALSQTPGRMREAIAHLEAADRIQPDPEIRQMLEKLRSESK